MNYQKSQPTYRIGVVLKAMNSHYWMDVRSGMEQAAEDYQADLCLLYPSGEQEEAEQNDLIQDLLGNEIDTLLVAPCNSYRTKWFAEQAAAKNISVLMVDTRALDAELPYVGADNTGVGQTAAEYLNEVLPQNAEIVILSGVISQASHLDRITSFQQYLNPSFTVTQIFYTDILLSEGYTCAKSVIGQGVDAIFCTSAVVGLGVATAQEELHDPNLRIVAVDTMNDALQAVQDGTMDALISQSGYDIGYQAIATAVESLRAGTACPSVQIEGKLLTQENLEVDENLSGIIGG